MKTSFLRLITVTTMALLLVNALTSCKDRFPSGYLLELPELPETWVSLLGEPCWRVEWLSPDGVKKMTNIMINDNSTRDLEIEIPITWTNPVTAWPFWPEHNLIPGLFKPAGALFPFDTSGNRLHLSWEAGVDTVFYWELAFNNEENLSRLPVNFDWPRFRELFEDKILNEAVCEDPWLVNWRSVAEKTVNGNFDRRRLVAEKTENRKIQVPESAPKGTSAPKGASAPKGTSAAEEASAVEAASTAEAACEWYGTSPFAKPLFFEDGEPSIFPLRPGLNVWISEAGILRVDKDVWIFIEW